MKHKLAIFTLLIFFIGIGIGVAQKPSKSCPRNFDGKTLTALKKDFKISYNSPIAFDVVVQKIQTGYGGRSYFKGSLDNGETLWIASMMSNLTIVVGQKFRILGYIGFVEKDDEIGMRFNKKGIQVRAFAILDPTTKQLVFSDAFETEAKTWQSGSLPK